ncbi:MAG: DNA mismatch repair protein MutS [Chitinivibrionales bacterium]|nr:DNA mismatch repair protein MutS [Chitinivibrionales bacterium]
MRQYMDIKGRNPGAVLLYRMGDFYEMFNEDAQVAAKVLGLTLTSRNHGGADPTPLAGFPHHAIERYANRLVKAGYRIAICEQTEDPKAAKGIVQRDVIEVISAGTAMEDTFIDERSNNYIVAVLVDGDRAGLGICDLSTGDFSVEELAAARLEEEFARLEPAEVLLPEETDVAEIDRALRSIPHAVVTRFDGWKFAVDSANEALLRHFGIASLDALGLEGYTCGIGASGALLLYLKEQKRSDLRHITALRPRTLGEYAELDPSSIRNLELLKPLHSDEVGGTLLSVLDRTGSAMGARLLKRWITHPLRSIEQIQRRLDGVAWLRKDVFVRRETELFLHGIADIERLIGRVTLERANARDLVALRRSLGLFPRIIKTLNDSTPPTIAEKIAESLQGFEPMVEDIAQTIVDDPPLSIREGGIITKGRSAKLDELVEAATNGKQWIAGLQEQEREKTGISSLKVGYNKVFGYYIEVSKANLGAVPQDYIRKQTLVNGERFVTPALKEMEEKILGAEEKRAALEYELFVELRTRVAEWCPRIQKAAEAVAVLDVLVAFARVAAERNYVRPQLDDTTDLHIADGRHPVVEQMSAAEQFVPNDAVLSSEDAQIVLITGPNMAGKSTYLRQNALIAIMAQMGCFVPATAARIGIVDRFFTRVGASDRLARGQSTFLVEMIEVANILNNATDHSLVLLDEVGRGTSTFDGISIAWAVAEYLHETKNRRARTLFATHYHELTELALLFPRIKNLHVKVKEWNDEIIFVRKIAEGSCDHSYGIQVARLAGVPKEVIVRAREILSNLENMELTPDHKPVLARRHADGRAGASQTDLFDGVQMNLLDSHAVEILDQLANIDINTLRPLDALTILSELHDKARSR